MKSIFEYYLKNIPHRGKRHAVRAALALLPYKSVRSHYGPIMQVNRGDKTNLYAIWGEYGETVADHVRKLQSGEVFIDIGANYGLFSLMAASRVGEGGHVLSFEPNPVIYSHFLANIGHNKYSNITPFNMAISDSNKQIGLSFEKGHSGKSRLSDNGAIMVQAVNPADMPELTTKIGDKNVHIKIDVEGYEAEILKIIMKADWFKNVKSIIVEIDEKNLKEFGNTSDDIYTPLKHLEFTPTINGKAGAHYDEIFIR